MKGIQGKFAQCEKIDPSIFSHEIRSFFFWAPFAYALLLPNFGRLEINSHIVFWSIFISFFVSFFLWAFGAFLCLSSYEHLEHLYFLLPWASFLELFGAFFVKVWSIFVSFLCELCKCCECKQVGEEVYGVQSGASRAMVTRESILEREGVTPSKIKSQALGGRHKKNMRKTS